MRDDLHQHVLDMRGELKETRHELAATNGEVMRQGAVQEKQGQVLTAIFTKLDLALRPIARPAWERRTIVVCVAVATAALSLIAFAAVAMASR